MRLTKVRRSTNELADDAFDAYVAWREECTVVHDTYDWWKKSSTAHALFAFEAYRRALLREERAANRYAQLLGFTVAETGPTRDRFDTSAVRIA
jgi:hypothetical protein